jgi:hypothetical protein
VDNGDRKAPGQNSLGAESEAGFRPGLRAGQANFTSIFSPSRQRQIGWRSPATRFRIFLKKT